MAEHKIRKFQFPNFFRINATEKIFRGLLKGNSFIVVLLLLAIFVTLLAEAYPAIHHNGLRFVFKAVWDPISLEFGAKSFLLGTLLTSFLAVLISAPFSLAIAVFLGSYFRHGFWSQCLKSAIDLLAGIPSVIYGFWSLYVLVPFMRSIQISLGLPPLGVGIFTASVILAIMIIPYSASIAREVISMVPRSLEEGAYSLGATKTETILKVVIPYARSGIFSGVFLALGRALGETMAVTMVIGNTSILPTSIFSPGNTISSVIANEFAEATDVMYLKTLVSLGLLLFLVTTIISFIGRYIIRKWKVETHEAQ